MKLTPRQYAVALYESVAATAPSNRDSVLKQFIKLLAEKNRLSLLPRITEQLKNLERAEQGITLAQLTTAKAWPASEAQKFKRALGKDLGTDIELETKVNPNILGGAVLQIGDTIIDGSISQSLKALKASLTEII